MVNQIIDWSLENRFIVMLLAVVLLGAGAVSVTTLPLDAVPDLTNVQVQVLTTSPALGPVEVEQFITFPVENAMSGLPRVSEIRSISRFGLSAVTVAFEDGTDIYWARNLINERLQQHGQIDASEVIVSVNSGEVTLSGQVDSRMEKRMAEDVVESCPGAREVHNNLRVKGREQEQQNQYGQQTSTSQTQYGTQPEQRSRFTTG